MNIGTIIGGHIWRASQNITHWCLRLGLGDTVHSRGIYGDFVGMITGIHSLYPP